MVKSGAIPRPRDLDPELPGRSSEIILKALAFHRDDRFQTGRDLQHELGRFQLEWAQKTGEPDRLRRARPVPAPTSLQPAERPGRQRHRRAAPAAISARTDPAGGGRAPAPSRERPAAARPRDVDAASIAGAGRPPSRRREVARAPSASTSSARGPSRGMAGARAEARAPRRHAPRQRVLRASRATSRSSTRRLRPPRIDEAGPAPASVGLPIASEDDALARIRLALALVDALDGIGCDVEPELRLAVGLQRGVALVRAQPARARSGFELSEATTAMAPPAGQRGRRAATSSSAARCPARRAATGTSRRSPTIDLPVGAAAEERGRRRDRPRRAARARVYRLRGPKERAQRLRERGATSATAARPRARAQGAARRVPRRAGHARRKRQVVIVGDAGVGKRALVGAFLDGIQPGEAMRRPRRRARRHRDDAARLIADLGRDVLGLAEGAEPHEVERRLRRPRALFYFDPADEPEVRAAVRAAAPLLGAPARGRRRTWTPTSGASGSSRS